MSSQTETQDAFGTIFAIIGGFVGFGYGAQISDGHIGAALVIGFIGIMLGRVVGNIVFRLVLIGLIVLGFMIRDHLFEAVLQGLGS